MNIEESFLKTHRHINTLINISYLLCKIFLFCMFASILFFSVANITVSSKNVYIILISPICFCVCALCNRLIGCYIMYKSYKCSIYRCMFNVLSSILAIIGSLGICSSILVYIIVSSIVSIIVFIVSFMMCVLALYIKDCKWKGEESL